MKKRDKQQVNPQKQPLKDLQYLQKKLGEEKENLVRENKKLQKQIHEQIQENRLLKISFQKKQQIHEKNIEQLKAEIERLKNQMLFDRQNYEDKQQVQENLTQTLKSCKLLTIQNQQLKRNNQQNLQVIMKMEEEINNLEKQNAKQKKKIKEEQAIIQNFRKQIQGNKELYKEVKEELDENVKQLNKQIQQNRKLDENLSYVKKKNKQFSELMKGLQQKFQTLQTQEYSKFQSQLNDLKNQKEVLYQEGINKQRQIQFLKLSINQKDQYIESLTNEMNELKISNEIYIKQNGSLSSNFQRVQNQNRRLIIDQQREKSKGLKEAEQIQKNHEQQISRIKRKIAEELGLIFKNGSENKALQSYMEGLRSHKSQANLRGGVSLVQMLKQNQQKAQTIPLQKFKYETQIMNLNSEIQNLKRQIQANFQQSSKLRKSLEQKKHQIEQKNTKIKQISLQFDKLENEKNLEQNRLNKQIIKFRNVETELLETKRNYLELQEATNLKISYYDKKIKEYLDAIDRKDSIIQNLKIQRTQAQNKAKFMQEKLTKIIQQAENLKRYKNDNLRKEDLIKDYKDRLEKSKTQLQIAKNDVQKYKKEKTRLERNLQSKQEYISTLKAKNLKEQQQKEQQAKQEKNLKQLKQKYEVKLKRLKKQIEQFQEIVESLRSVIAQKIQEAIKKSSSQEPPRKNNWEAAHVLGLKSGEIEEFVNPTINLDRHICEDLDQLWQKRKYEQFMRNSIQYLLLKNETQTADPFNS